MSIRNLDHLLRPRSVALIGATPRQGSLGAIIARNMLRAGFKGSIAFVNPKYGEIDGRRCFASVAALPEAPELAVLVTPPATIPGLVGELGRKGTRAAVVITAGVKGELRQAMLDAARPHLLRIQGPNCLGLMLPPLGLDASFSPVMPPAGGLALVSQSGALVTAIADWAVDRGIGLSHVVSIGDMADVDFGDLLDYLSGDTQSSAILLYIEQLTHAGKFMSAARRAARAKPVIAIKSGRHAAGARAAMSHTGALAGSDAAYDAAFRRAGILRVNELEDFFNAAEMLSRAPLIQGERLAVLTNGGGAGVLAADRLADLDGRLAAIPAETMAALDGVLPPTWSRGNPIDIIGDADAERYARALEQLLALPTADAILVINCPTALTSGADIAAAVVAAQKSQCSGSRPRKPLLANWLGEGTAREGRKILSDGGIPVFETPADAIEGYMQLVRYRRAQDELMQVPPPMAEGPAADIAGASAIITEAMADGRTTLSEVESKRLLACHLIPVVATAVAATPEDVEREAARLLAAERAVVVKILSHDISHKSDVGGVRLGLESAGAAGSAAREMLARAARARPDARIQGFTVQAMVRRPAAHELIIGMSVDPTFGPLVMFGAGGTAVEVLRDTRLAMPPLDLVLARELIRHTRVARVLEGYRNRPAADFDAIARALVNVSGLVIAHPEIRELDINPLLADETGVIALDARFRIARADEEERAALAIRPYPVRWVHRGSLPALGEVIVRPIRPEDERLYDAFLKRLSSEDLRFRFFIARPHLSHRAIARLTQIDYAREMAFVALDAASGALLGVSRLAADPDYAHAEFAVIVASDLKGKGLGWRLMQQLIAYARAEGIDALYGDVLAENTTMLTMCERLGFEITYVPDDPGLRHAVLKLAAHSAASG